MKQQTQLWQLIHKRLSTELTPMSMMTWFDDTQVLLCTQNKLILCAPTFKMEHITARYIPAIKRALNDIFSEEFEVEVVDNPDTFDRQQEEQKVKPSNLFSQYTFSNFVVGKSNEFAHAAALSVTISPATENNPLFLHGDSGLGKTHLLYAMINKVKAERPDSVVFAVTAEQFTNEIITAIRTGTTKEFRDRYRPADMLFVDDIQFIGGKDYAMEEFFNTFNELYMSNHHLVFTSDRPPREIPALTDRLRSRFESGLVVDIQPPDFETRVAIIQKKAASCGIILSDDISYFIAENITLNVRQLEGAVKKIAAYHQLLGKPLSMETAQSAISDLFSENPGTNPSSDLIIDKVCHFFNVEIDDLLSSSKRANIVYARQTAIYLVRSLMDISLSQIGTIFRRDHTTVMHSLDQVEKRKASSENVQKELDTITRNIRG